MLGLDPITSTVLKPSNIDTASQVVEHLDGSKWLISVASLDKEKRHVSVVAIDETKRNGERTRETAMSILDTIRVNLGI